MEPSLSIKPPELSQPQRHWRMKVFGATWFSYFAYYFCRKPFYIAKATIGDEFGLDASALAVLGSVYLIAYTLGQFIAAFFGDKTGPRILLLSGMATTLAVNIAFGFSNTYAMFIVLMGLNGLAQATGWPGNIGAMAPWFRRHERGRVLGVWATNYQVGGVVANTMAAFALGLLGYRFAFFGGAMVMLVAWTVVVLYQRNRPEDLGLAPICEQEQVEADSSSRGSWTRATVVNVCIIGMFYFFLKFIRYALWSWTPYLLETNYDLAGDEAGFLSTIFDLTGIGGVLVCGWLSDKYFNGKRALPSFIFIAVMVIGCLSLWTLGANNLWIFGASLGLVGVALYGPDALMTGAGAMDIGSAKHAAMAAGIINGMGSAGSVAQELILGELLSESSVSSVFAVLLVSSILGAASLVWLLIRNRRGLSTI